MTEILDVRDILQEAQTRLGAGLTLRHIASHHKTSVLKQHVVDFVFAGTLAHGDEPQGVDDEITFQRFQKLRIGLLSNYKIAPAANPTQLLRREKEYLLPPTHGIFRDILATFLP